MNFAQIETALGLQLRDVLGNGIAIAWPNQDFTPTGEYVEFRHSPSAVTDETTSGNYAYQTGLMLATVITPAGNFSTRANELAQLIAGGFRKGLRLSAGAGTVLINAPASPAPAFPDGAYFRLPVRISYLTEGS